MTITIRVKHGTLTPTAIATVLSVTNIIIVYHSLYCLTGHILFIYCFIYCFISNVQADGPSAAQTWSYNVKSLK